jgi:hypothetical protein
MFTASEPFKVATPHPPEEGTRLMQTVAQAQDATPEQRACTARLIAAYPPEPRHVSAADALLALDTVTAESVRQILEASLR